MSEAARIAALADFAARHAVALLLALTALLLAFAWIAWHVLEHQGPRLLAPLARAWPPADRRSRLLRYLGLCALLGFAVAGAGVVAFFELADEIGAGEELAAFDVALAAALARHLDGTTLAFFGAVTHLGDPLLLWPIGFAVALGLAWRGERLLVAGWIVAAGGGALLNFLLKRLFERSRPVHEHGYASADGFSFPSGHASGSLLVYGMLAYLIVRHTPPRWHPPVAAIVLLLIVFVGASRVLLQVHWFSDVLAGWAHAAAWTALCIAALEAVRLAAPPRED